MLDKPYITKITSIISKLIKIIVKDFPGFGLYFVTIAMIISMPYAWASGYQIIFKCMAYFVFVLFIGLYFWIFYRTINFNKYVKCITKLTMLLAETTLVFAAIYMWFVFFDPKGQLDGFGDYHKVFKSQDKNIFLGKDYIVYVVKLVIDTFHFSVVTAATVGYGDMKPTSYIAKILVDFQIIYTFAIVVIGIGKYSDKKTETIT